MSPAARSRLGRGLEALLGEGYLAATGPRMDVRTLAVGSVAPNPFQPRREFRPDELAELSASIRDNGLLQPIVVRPVPGGEEERYELVAGERRLRAVVELGWDGIPALVRDVTDKMLLVLALVENLQRSALNPVEEAVGLQQLADEFGLTHGEIGEAIGKNRSTVANRIRLLGLPVSVRRLLEGGSLTMGHARALLAVEDPGRRVELGRRAAEEGWSVREVEARCRAESKPRRSGGNTGRNQVRNDPVARALEEALRASLGTRVRLKGTPDSKGVVEIPFRGQEDFQRLVEILTGRPLREITG